MTQHWFQKPNGSALAFLIAGAAWFMVGTTYGMFSAIHMVSPEFFSNIPWLVFGRVRPSHVNTVIYGFAVSTLIGAGMHYVPTVLKTRLWSETLGWISFVFWTATVLSGPLTFAFGVSQGREYTEYVWIADVSLMIAALAMVLNLIMTIVHRQEHLLYVSVWYFTGTFLWAAGIYPIGNVMWRPPTGALHGLVDSIILWFYGHNLPGLILTPIALGAAFYVLPRVAQMPLYSHTLSLIGFWTLIALYAHIGGHHLLQAPVPNWLKAISVVDSMAMVIPVFVVLANLWLTIRQRGAAVWHNPAGRFVLAGTIWYLATCIQGPLQSLPFLQQVTHFNNWTIGHSHIAVLGFAGFIAVGTLWYVIPEITHRRIYSRTLTLAQFWLLTIGLMGFFVVLTTAGLIQGHGWHNGETVYRILPEINFYMAARATFGVFVLSAAYIGFFNLMMTLKYGRRFDPQVDEEYFG